LPRRPTSIPTGDDERRSRWAERLLPGDGGLFPRESGIAEGTDVKMVPQKSRRFSLAGLLLSNARVRLLRRERAYIVPQARFGGEWMQVEVDAIRLVPQRPARGCEPWVLEARLLRPSRRGTHYTVPGARPRSAIRGHPEGCADRPESAKRRPGQGKLHSAAIRRTLELYFGGGTVIHDRQVVTVSNCGPAEWREHAPTHLEDRER
jgi:hypothetical protein